MPSRNDLLRLHELIGLTGTLTAEQMTVLSNLLHHSGVNSVALLEGLLGGRPLANEAGDEGRGVGVLAGLADAIEKVSPGNRANSDVETALFGGNAIVSEWSWTKAVLPEPGHDHGGGELTPKPSFTGSWAAWEPQRR